MGLVANEPGPYGIGGELWPGHGKVVEECAELLTVLGKLQGSAGAAKHWSGDLIQMMRDEIADVRAALRFFEEANPILDDGTSYIACREDWKLQLFRSWQRGDPSHKWPHPEAWGLPPRYEA